MTNHRPSIQCLDTSKPELLMRQVSNAKVLLFAIHVRPHDPVTNRISKTNEYSYKEREIIQTTYATLQDFPITWS